MLDGMKPKDKRRSQGVVINLIGMIIIATNLFPLFYMMGLPFTFGTVRTINYLILGIAFILTGTFTLKPRRTKKGIIVIGSISTIIGGILIISTMQIIVALIVRFGGTSLIYIFWNDIPILAILMISGTILLLHGLILIIKRRKNIKLIWGVIFASIGITVVVWVSHPLYMSIISSTYYPFFDTVIYLNIIIVGVSSLLIGFFYFNPPEKKRIKLLIGMISIIFGSVMVIFSVLGILSFSLYVVGYDSDGGVASMMDLNSIFVVFIFVGVGLIINGVIKIKKNMEVSLITLIKKKKKLILQISLLLSLTTFFTIFIGFSLPALRQTTTSFQSNININNFEWNKTWGGSSNEQVSGMAIDSLGNIFITGSAGRYGGEDDDNIFLLKYNSGGNLVWNITWGQSDYDYSSGIAIDSTGNAFITGRTESYGAGHSDVFILKYNSSGDLLWGKIWGGSDDEWAPKIAIDASGNVFISGSTESYGEGYSDVFLVKYDSSGNLLWDKAWGGSERDLGIGIALDDSGNAFIMGWTLSYGAGSEDVFLLKYNSSGNLLWNKTWGGSGYEYAYEIALDASGNTFITGVTSSYGAGHSSVFLLKYDPSGNLLWDKTWGGSSGETGRELAIDASGNVYITGETASFGAGYSDAFILKYDSSGNLLWDKTWGSSGNDYGKGIAIDSLGNTFITGSIGVYEGGGDKNLFLLKYNSSGNLLLYKTWEGKGYISGIGIALDTLGNAFIAGETGYYEVGFDTIEIHDLDVFLLKHELDTDSDGLSDNDESNTYFTDSNNSDTDGDGLNDGWEVNYGLNATWSSDASLDGDSDGLTNHEEYQYDTDPTNSDTDGDGLSDGDEVNKYHTDPTNTDTDGDQYSDNQEIQMGTDPLSSLSNISITLTIIIVIILSVGVASLIISKYRKNKKKKGDRV